MNIIIIRGIQTDEQTNKENDDDVQCLLLKRYHRLYVMRTGGIELASIEECVDAVIQGLERYIIKESLIKATSNRRKQQENYNHKI